MKKLNRILIFTCLSLTLLNSNIMASPKETYISPKNTERSISQRIEETEWRYRVVDGRLQKRLWSIIQNKWLTDWEWV